MGFITLLAACTLAAQPGLFVSLDADTGCPPAPVAKATVRSAPALIAQWEPYISEASQRFDVSAQWVRGVMRAESGGRQLVAGRPITSRAGAMGIMQIMPRTYAALRQRYALGDDPYDPRNSILAGTAYIREMYDRFGVQGFAAAYNAGPARFVAHLRGGRPLPAETRRYLLSAGALLDGTWSFTPPVSPSLPTAPSGADSTIAGARSGHSATAAEPPNLGATRAEDARQADRRAANDSALFVPLWRHSRAEDLPSDLQPFGRSVAEQGAVGARGSTRDDALFVTLGTHRLAALSDRSGSDDEE